MPYPGENLNASLFGPFTFKSSDGTTWTADAPYQTRGRVHPASTSNPIQADGTRRMSGWWHYGGSWRSPSNADGRYDHPFDPTIWREYKGCITTANIDVTQLQVWRDGAVQSRLNALASWSERQVEYSMALRQAGQTARMVGDLGTGLANELSEAMSRRGSNIARHWRKLPEWYLQYLYGWKPLMDDISNITDRLVKGFDAGNSLHVTLKGRWKGDGEMSFSNSGGGIWGGGFNTLTTLMLRQVNTSTFKYAFPADRLPNLEPIGFFGGLWEGAPYSFVLDWISPVGTWLNALDANALACYFVEGSTSESVKTIGVRTEHKPIGVDPSDVTLRNFETRLLVAPYRMSRVLETPWSITSRVPFRTDLNLRHAAQGLALLSQAMKRLY